MKQNKIYVGNLPYETSEDDLRQAFSNYGDLKEVNLITDKFTGRSKGFAFVTFDSQEAAESSLEMNGKEFSNRTIKVNMAKERQASNGWNK